jgi:hypothetical protein
MAKVRAQIVVDDGASKTLQEIKKNIAEVGQTAKSIEGIAMLDMLQRVGGAIVNVWQNAYQGFSEAEQATLKLQGALQATGNQTGFTQNQLLALADSLEKTKLVNGDTATSAIALATSIGTIKGDNLKDVISISADMSKALQKDMGSIVQAISVAFSEEGSISKLRSLGIVLEESTVQMVDSLREQGRGVEAQALLIGELQKRYEGVANTMAGGLSGSMEKVKIAQDDLKKSLVDLTSPIVMLGNELQTNLLNGLNSLPDPIKAGALALGTGTLAVTAIGVAIVALGPIIEGLKLKFIGLQASLGPIGWVALALGALTSVGIGVATAISQAEQKAKQALDSTRENYKQFLQSMSDLTAREQQRQFESQVATLKTRLRFYQDLIDRTMENDKNMDRYFAEKDKIQAMLEEAESALASATRRANEEERSAREMQRQQDALAEQQRQQQNLLTAEQRRLEAQRLQTEEMERQRQAREREQRELAEGADLALRVYAGSLTDIERDIATAKTELARLYQQRSAESSAVNRADGIGATQGLALSRGFDTQGKDVLEEAIKAQETAIATFTSKLAELRTEAKKTEEVVAPAIVTVTQPEPWEALQTTINETLDVMETVGSRIGKIFSTWISQRNAVAENEIRQLQRTQSATYSSFELEIKRRKEAGESTYDLEKELMERKQADDEEIRKRKNQQAEKEFYANKLNSLAGIAMETARAVASSLPNMLLAGIVGGLGALQATQVATQQYVPAFASGGILYPSGNTNGRLFRGAEFETEYIFRQSQFDRLMGNRGSTQQNNYSVVVNGVVGDATAVALSIDKEIKKLQREGRA